MKLIIELDEKQFKDIQRIASIQIIRRSSTCEQIIANGIPLQKELFNIENELFKHLKYSDYVESEYVLTKDIEKVLKAH